MDSFIPLEWEQAVLCGACRDRIDYLAKLQAVCIAAAERSIREQYSRKDAELLQMVRTLDEIDTVINLLSERAAEWYLVRHPAFSRKYRRTPAHVLVKTMRERSKGALGRVAGEIEQLSETRTILAKEVSARANRCNAQHQCAYRRDLLLPGSCRMPEGFFYSPGYRQVRSRYWVPVRHCSRT